MPVIRKGWHSDLLTTFQKWNLSFSETMQRGWNRHIHTFEIHNVGTLTAVDRPVSVRRKWMRLSQTSRVPFENISEYKAFMYWTGDLCHSATKFVETSQSTEGFFCCVKCKCLNSKIIFVCMSSVRTCPISLFDVSGFASWLALWALWCEWGQPGFSTMACSLALSVMVEKKKMYLTIPNFPGSQRKNKDT